MAAHLVRRGGDFDVVVTSLCSATFCRIWRASCPVHSEPRRRSTLPRRRSWLRLRTVQHPTSPGRIGRTRRHCSLECNDARLAQSMRGDRLLSAAACQFRCRRTTIASGIATADLGGLASTSEFSKSNVRTHSASLILVRQTESCEVGDGGTPAVTYRSTEFRMDVASAAIDEWRAESWSMKTHEPQGHVA